MYVSLVVVHPQWEEISKAYPMQKLGTESIGDSIDYLTAIILRRVDLKLEWPFAKWYVNDIDHVAGGGRYIPVQRVTDYNALQELID
jgi:hypothetical protein